MKNKIIGLGKYLPGPQINNKQIAERFNLNEEWINYFIGTKYRHFSIDLLSGDIQFDLADMCYEAAIQAIKQANLHANDIEAIVMATATPDNLMPATVNLVADRLGINGVPTYGLQSGCAGAIQAIDIGLRILKSGPEKTVLVIGGDTCNKFMNLNQDFLQLSSKEIINYVLFGDGAGALILSNCSAQKGIWVNSVLNKFIGKDKPPGQVINWHGVIDIPNHLNLGVVSEDYKAIEANVPLLANELMQDMLKIHNWRQEDIHYFLPPQLSKVMTNKIIAHLGIPIERAVNCIEYTANTGNALPFIQLEVIFEKIKPDEKGIILAIESSKWLKAGVAFHG